MAMLARFDTKQSFTLVYHFDYGAKEKVRTGPEKGSDHCLSATYAIREGRKGAKRGKKGQILGP